MTKIDIQANKIFESVNQSTCRYVLLKGSAGSGKSVDTAQNYIMRLMKDRGRNLLALRKSEITNRDSTFAELQSAVYRLGEAASLWKITLNPLELTFKPNGNKIIFRGMNDAKQREKIKSITFSTGDLTDIWLEEATEFTKEDVNILDDRLRGILPDGYFYQMRFTFNPVSSRHWIKKEYFDTSSPYVFTHQSTYLDNRFIDDAYHARMMRRKELDPAGYVVYGLGEWGEIEGQILRNWEASDISLNYQDYDSIAIGQDFGFNHANAILVLGIKDDNVYILQEVYEYEKDAAEVIALANAGGIPKNRDMWCDSAEPARIKTWKNAGYRARKVVKEKNSIQAQIDWLKQRRIYIHPSCTNTLAEVDQWKWKKDDRAGVYLDTPVEFFDDAMAALRYGVEGWRKRNKNTVRTVQGRF